MFFLLILPDFMDLLEIHGSATAQNNQSPVEMMSSSHNTYAKEIPGKNVIKVLSIIYMYLLSFSNSQRAIILIKNKLFVQVFKKFLCQISHRNSKLFYSNEFEQESEPKGGMLKLINQFTVPKKWEFWDGVIKMLFDLDMLLLHFK